MDKVKAAFSKAFNFVKGKLASVSKKILIGVGAGAAVLIVSLIILAAILNQTKYAVLYSNASSTEASEIIAYAKDTLGVDDIKLNANGDIIVPEDQVEELRVNLSIAGYPKSTFNYDLYSSSVSMFSSSDEIREYQRQQLESNLRATFCYFEGVNDAIVILNIPENDDYVISSSAEESSAAVTLDLRTTLTSEQIDGMYNLLANSVPGLDRNNITITDNTGAQLIPGASESDSDIETQRLQLYYQRLNYSDKLKSELEEDIRTVMNGAFDEFNVSVGLILNYDNEVLEETLYSGTNVDEDGNQSGIVSDETYKSAASGTAAEGGVVGTTINSDISPDYPTLEVEAGDDFYYEAAREINYKVNETKRQVESNGYKIDTLSASVVVKSNNDFTTEEETRWRNIIARAIGADPENVAIRTAAFVETSSNLVSGDSIRVNNVSSGSLVMIAVIIVLGVILIVLLILALRAPGARKRRRPINKLAPAAAGAINMGGYSETGEDAENIAKVSSNAPNDTDFELTSLDDTPETRDEALKREIQDFSRNNPEIVAQLIRNWIRGDE